MTEDSPQVGGVLGLEPVSGSEEAEAVGESTWRVATVDSAVACSTLPHVRDDAL